MSEPGPGQVFDIRDRAFEFAVRIVKLCKYLEKNSGVSRSVISQLLRAGTSVGANLEEARAGQSPADFIHKNAVSLKEAGEAHYWLPKPRMKALRMESANSKMSRWSSVR